MYGKLPEIPEADLLPLYVAAGAYGVCILHVADRKVETTGPK